MLKLHPADVRSVLCLGAHADDIEIGCGATILRVLADFPQVRIHWVVFSASGPRRQEAVESATLFLAGASRHSLAVHEFEDCYFPHQCEQIRRLFHEMYHDIQPDVIFTHRCDDAHQDHRTIGELTWCTFRNHLILEYEIPKYEGDLGHPNVFSCVDESICRKKIQYAMQAYRSQQNKDWFTEDTYWALMRLRGVESHSPSRFAEGFYARKLCI